ERDRVREGLQADRLAANERQSGLCQERYSALEARRTGVLCGQLAADEPPVDRLAEDRSLPERQSLEPGERLDGETAPLDVALCELAPGGKALGGGDRRGAERVLLAARLAVGGEQVADVGPGIADGAHLPVEHRADAGRPLVFEDHVAEPVIAVDDG